VAGQIKVPPSDDFTGFSGLVSKQGEHFGPMVAWTGQQCSDVDGLDGLLTVIKPTVKGEAEEIGDLLKQCQKGMGTIKDKVTTVDQELRTEDEKNAAALKTAFPDAVSGVPDISTQGTPAGEQLNFNDEDINLKEPASEKSPSGSILTGLIAGQIPGAKDKDEESMFKKILSGEGVKGKLSNTKEVSIDKTKTALRNQVTGDGNEVWIADKAFKMVTGHSFIDLLLKPLLGDWDRLMYLHDAYDTLGDACYTVAGNLRKGSWKIGTEWQGDTATAFDSYMFRWTNGIGGVGDRAKVVAGYYKDGYEAVLTLVQIVVSYASKVIDNEVKELAKEAAKVLAVDTVTEIAGGGPEDPFADAIAAAYTATKAVKIYKLVRAVVNCMEQIQNYYNDIRQAVELVQSMIEKLKQNSGGWGDRSAGGLIQDVEQHGFDFEKQSGWSAKDGVSRTGYLAAL
jgi:hypothetical protein